MNKTVTVFCGISGAGKTFQRSKAPYKRLPFIDMGQLRKRPGAEDYDWYDFLQIAIEEAKTTLQSCNHLVIEGYFLPYSQSRELLTQALQPLANIEFIFLNTPLKVCLQRLSFLYDSQQISKADYIRRSDLAKRVHKSSLST
jgi:predicted kinase